MAGFGARLKELRERSGLSQVQVADAIGVSSAYISSLESGKKPAPPRALVSRLATSIGAQEEDLWELARVERDERIRQRVEGVPTSLRSSTPGSGSLVREGSKEELGTDPPNAEIGQDKKLAELLLSLNRSLPDKQVRDQFIELLGKAINTLKH